MAVLGFIGCGNMGFAMLKGASSIMDEEELMYTDASAERMEMVKSQIHKNFVETNLQLVNECQFIVLAIKPQYLSGVLEEIKEEVGKYHIIISILPGVTIHQLKEDLGEEIRIVRAMPNTPAMVLEGMSAISFSDDYYSEDEKQTVYEFFGSFGKYEEVEERLLDASVCAVGSSPAYVYLLIEALADSAVKYGIPREKAYKMVAQTVYGSAKMVLETKQHPGVLKDQVCSPGGTTIAAVSALEEWGFRNAIMKASDQCYEKTVSFQKK